MKVKCLKLRKNNKYLIFNLIAVGDCISIFIASSNVNSLRFDIWWKRRRRRRALCIFQRSL